MTYDEITTFRHFMTGKGMLGNYEYLYRTHRLREVSLEQFLEETRAEDVLMTAFDFEQTGSTIFKEEFFRSLNEKWQIRLKEFRDTGVVGSGEQIRCPHCDRLLPRNNFVLGSKGLHKHCKECESGEWDRKRKEEEKAEKEREQKEKEIRALEKEIADKQYSLQLKTAALQGDENLMKTTKVCTCCGKRKLRSEFSPSDTSEDGLQSWCNKCQGKMENISNSMDTNGRKEREDEGAGIQEDKERSIPRLGEYDATMHYKTYQKSITFNSILSEAVIKGGFTKCYLNESDRGGRKFLIFNNAEGANVSIVNNRTKLCIVYSKEICTALAEHFRLRVGESYYLHITRNLANRNDFITIEVKTYRTKEEFLSIVEKREQGADDSSDSSSGREEVTARMKEDKSTKRQKDGKPAAPAEAEKPAVQQDDFIHFDFGDGKTAPPSSDELLQQLMDRHLTSERDIAAFLHKRGWRLQEPVRAYKKFTL